MQLQLVKQCLHIKIYTRQVLDKPRTYV